MERINDRYNLYIDCDILRFNEIRNWCWDQFGSDWGEQHYVWSVPSGPNRYCFAFKRLYHAQWFMMKWSTVDN